MKSSEGLTLLEVLMSMVVLGIITSIFSASLVSSFSSTRNMGSLTDANIILNYFGRMSAGGAGRSLGYAPTAGKVTFAYGTLSTSFPELTSNDINLKNPNLYRVTVTSPSTIAVGDIQLYQYLTEVCWKERNADKCISAPTAGPLISPTEQVGN